MFQPADQESGLFHRVNSIRLPFFFKIRTEFAKRLRQSHSGRICERILLAGFPDQKNAVQAVSF
ncbi:hypothetical protein [Holdemania sp. Marseille-P2844]|uniref:hypothetical protein n=1 Tax=Holdemania sp. Marseille-P2844 TaxID=1852366 RepID=UPI001F2EA08C|nr:hypothetical protein [Holdemania sp. Marseille-P2844]